MADGLPEYVEPPIRPLQNGFQAAAQREADEAKKARIILVMKSCRTIDGVCKAYQSYAKINRKKSPETQLTLILDKLTLLFTILRGIASETLMQEGGDLYYTENKVHSAIDNSLSLIDATTDDLINDLNNASGLISDPNSAIKRIEELMEAMVYHPDNKPARNIVKALDEKRNDTVTTDKKETSQEKEKPEVQ